MKKPFQIIVMVLVSLLLSSRSCVDDSEKIRLQEKEVNEAENDIREEFGREYMDEGSRYAAEKSAIQKLADLADYINIYSDTSLDSAFRIKAKEMIRDIFYSEDASLPFKSTAKGKLKNLSVRNFLDKGFGDNVSSVEISYDSIITRVPLERSEKSDYEGSISGIQQMTCFSPTDTLISTRTWITVEVVAFRKVKIFGKDTLEVWQVSLGDMTVNE